MTKAAITLQALFRTADGSDVAQRDYSEDVTDTRAELLVGRDEWAAAGVDEDLVDGLVCRLGWDADPLFIEWQVARVEVA